MMNLCKPLWGKVVPLKMSKRQLAQDAHNLRFLGSDVLGRSAIQDQSKQYGSGARVWVRLEPGRKAKGFAAGQFSSIYWEAPAVQPKKKDMQGKKGGKGTKRGSPSPSGGGLISSHSHYKIEQQILRYHSANQHE